jgi:hypothetical protein
MNPVYLQDGLYDVSDCECLELDEDYYELSSENCEILGKFKTSYPDYAVASRSGRTILVSVKPKEIETWNGLVSVFEGKKSIVCERRRLRI